MESIFPLVPTIRPWLALALLASLLAWESFAPFFRFSGSAERIRHGGKNILLGVGNALLTGFVFSAAWLAVAVWAEEHRFGLLHRFSLPLAARVLAVVLFLDLWTYAWHRMNHRVPLLWRFHRVHHSDPWMDVTTANRFHFGEIILSSLLRLPLIALLGLRLEELALYELLLFANVQFHHANIGLPPSLDRFLRTFLVTPVLHKVHHSRWQPETDSNYGSLLSVWDRLFRSFRLNPDPSSIRFGLEEFSDPACQRLPALLTTPWKQTPRLPGKKAPGP